MCTLKYFNDDDFKRATPSCAISQMCPDFLARLDRARELAGVPFHVNSAYRSPDYEISKGRSGAGAHTFGRAVDIRCTDSASRWRIVFGALSAGFTRIGIGKRFVHLDDSISLPHPCIWLY